MHDDRRVPLNYTKGMSLCLAMDDGEANKTIISCLASKIGLMRRARGEVTVYPLTDGQAGMKGYGPVRDGLSERMA